MNERYKYSLFSIFYIKNFFKFHIQKTVQDTFKLIKTCYQMRLYKAQYIESWIYGVPAYAFFVSKYCIQRLSYTDSNSIVNLSLLNLHRSISIKYLLHNFSSSLQLFIFSSKFTPKNTFETQSKGRYSSSVSHINLHSCS